jgi:protease I
MQQDTRQPVAVVLVEQGGQTTEITTPVDYFKGEGFKTLVTVPMSLYGSQPILDKHGIPVKYNSILDGKVIKVVQDGPHEEYTAEGIDIIIVPGGWQLPEKLRMNHDVLSFLKMCDSYQKVIGSVCHGPWVLISANLVRNRTISAYKGIKDDVQNAGAQWHPGPVCTFGHMVTAPHYDYMGPFMKEVLRVYATRNRKPAEIAG